MVNKDELAPISLFSQFSDEEREKIASITDRKEFRKDTSIINEGSSGGELFIIHQGKVNITRVIREHEYQTLAILRDGDFFGSLSFIDGCKHCASAVCATDSIIFNTSKGNFDKLVDKDPKLGIKLLTIISINNCLHLRRMNSKVFDLIKYVLISTVF